MAATAAKLRPMHRDGAAQAAPMQRTALLQMEKFRGMRQLCPNGMLNSVPGGIRHAVQRWDQAGLSATGINSTLSRSEQADVWRAIRAEREDFVFTTPEQLHHPEFLSTLKGQKIGLFVIDEAHCISQWGHDFRPAYLQLGAVIAALGHPTVLALTATAPDEVVSDIIKQLCMPDMRIINTGIYRPNLFYEVCQACNEAEKNEQLIQVLRRHSGSGIVYATTVKAIESNRDWCAAASCAENADKKRAGNAGPLNDYKPPLGDKTQNLNNYL